MTVLRSVERHRSPPLILWLLLCIPSCDSFLLPSSRSAHYINSKLSSTPIIPTTVIPSSVYRTSRCYNSLRKQQQHQHGRLPSSLALSPDSLATLASTTTTMTSPEPIHTAFSIATFLPQPFWLLMILFPRANVTQKIMGGLEIPLLCSSIHLFIVVMSIVLGGSEATAPLAEFNDVFDPAGDPQAAFMGMTSSYPNFVAEEWSHVLTWDLFVGRWVWQHGVSCGRASLLWTAPSVLLCNLRWKIRSFANL